MEAAVTITGLAVEKGARATGQAVEWSARTTVDLTRTAVDAGVSQVGRFGRMVLAAWKFFERLSNPPWTPLKVLAWVGIFLLVAIITLLAYQFKYGILTLPIVEAAGSRFVAWMASGGALGLFGFTVVGTLFFMIIPTEPFFFLVIAGGTPAWAAIVAGGLGSTIGSAMNYLIGYRVRGSAGKKHGDAARLGRWGARAHSKYGTVLLFLAASLPLPELVALAYGLADYPFKKFLLVTLPGRFIKWTWIAVAFLAFQVSF